MREKPDLCPHCGQNPTETPHWFERVSRKIICPKREKVIDLMQALVKSLKEPA